MNTTNRQRPTIFKRDSFGTGQCLSLSRTLTITLMGCEACCGQTRREPWRCEAVVESAVGVASAAAQTRLHSFIHSFIHASAGRVAGWNSNMESKWGRNWSHKWSQKVVLTSLGPNAASKWSPKRSQNCSRGSLFRCWLVIRIRGGFLGRFLLRECSKKW